eukprot:TRINITY_DN6096_c0_g1_i1.p1 TRINITY_DN6096_c0_g1~~TRINITY_DN6096_c0_g1_i1.p1  ORF type:complete len:198 (-),score=-8.24 TRINITY_DN6096_c0_g1_i1:63-626(-)
MQTQAISEAHVNGWTMFRCARRMTRMSLCLQSQDVCIGGPRVIQLECAYWHPHGEHDVLCDHEGHGSDGMVVHKPSESRSPSHKIISYAFHAQHVSLQTWCNRTIGNDKSDFTDGLKQIIAMNCSVQDCNQHISNDEAYKHLLLGDACHEVASRTEQADLVCIAMDSPSLTSLPNLYEHVRRSKCYR